MGTKNQELHSDESCVCFSGPYQTLSNYRELGMDRAFAEFSILCCQTCRQLWLRYLYELEAFTASGRWYLGAITREQLSTLTSDNAKSYLEGLDWYYYGGSYFGGGRGEASGQKIFLRSQTTHTPI